MPTRLRHRPAPPGDDALYHQVSAAVAAATRPRLASHGRACTASSAAPTAAYGSTASAQACGARSGWSRATCTCPRFSNVWACP